MTSGGAHALLEALDSLSVAEFRTAGFLLADEILTHLSGKEYWNYFLYIVPANSRAYLGTFLKAAVSLYRKKELTLDEQVIADFSEKATPIDARKMLDAFLPVVRTVEEVEMLLRVFSKFDAETAAPALHRAGTIQAYYVLFKLMKTIDARPDLLRKNVLALMKRGDKLSFNLASVLCEYFDLRDIPGRFSLRLHPYELSRLDQGIENFEKLLRR